MVLSAETYVKCVQLKPDDFDLNLELALVYFHNIKNYEEVAICLKKCIELNPNRIDLYEKLYYAYWNFNDIKNAFDAYMCMGNLYLQEDDQENARNSFCCAAELDPIYYNCPFLDFSYKYFTIVIFLNSLLFISVSHDINILLATHTLYKQTIAIRPDFPDAYCDMGIIYYDERDLLENAKIYYEMAIKLNPTHFNARLKFDDILMKEQKMNVKAAIKVYEKQ
ncbi:hypothetical protein QTP88_024086 [Uroleucon formosanum]